ncbi:MAG: hypothetical protein AAF681_10290, partial [Pseudomonadota bacterium]
MKAGAARGLAAAMVAFLATATGAHADEVVFEFDVCGAPNSTVPGWVPNGDPNVNGKVTLTIDSEVGLMTLEPSEELLSSIRYVTLHAHLYDAKHRLSTSEKGQSTICWAYYNTTSRGGICDPEDYDCQSLTGVSKWPWQEYG